MDNISFDWQKFSLREKIGQMLVVRTTGYLFDHQIRYPAWEADSHRLQDWLQNLNLGGVILLGGSAAELALRTKQLQQWAKFPLFIAADIEEGVGQRFTGATWFPPPMALGRIAENNLSQAVDYAFTMGKITAQEALAMGINWILAPVVDVNNNPHNPVINIRAFSHRPEIVSSLATGFIKGANSFPVLTTAKHFPGHGDTNTDSHFDLPTISHNEARLEAIELPPFQGAIEAGVDSVMTAHLLIPAWDQKNPATLSYSILTEQLREKLSFEGLIVTDALIMGGITKFASSSQIAVQAIAAGADILLMPPNPAETIDSVENAVKSGILSEERINASLTRIFKAKEKLFSDYKDFSNKETKNIHINLEQNTRELIRNFNQNLAQLDCFATVEAILKETTITGGGLPLELSQSINNIIIVDDLLNCDFLDRQTPAVTMPEACGCQTKLFDQRNLGLVKENASPCLLQLFIRGNPFRGTAGLNAQAQQVYSYLFGNNLVQGLIIYGSPYVLDWFRPFFSSDFPWVFSYGQMPQAQRIACEYLLPLSRDDNLKQGNFL